MAAFHRPTKSGHRRIKGPNREIQHSSFPYRAGSSTNFGIIRNLQPNTFYEISIDPYREWSGTKDYGSGYGSIKGKTDCTGKCWTFELAT